MVARTPDSLCRRMRACLAFTWKLVAIHVRHQPVTPVGVHCILPLSQKSVCSFKPLSASKEWCLISKRIVALYPFMFSDIKQCFGLCQYQSSTQHYHPIGGLIISMITKTNIEVYQKSTKKFNATFRFEIGHNPEETDNRLKKQSCETKGVVWDGQRPCIYRVPELGNKLSQETTSLSTDNTVFAKLHEIATCRLAAPC